MKIVKKNSVQNEVYKILKDGIMSLKLVPGTVMSTQEMADKLGVSRTPVREAFIRLHEEGLVYVVPQKETIVSRIDMGRVMEERFIRESLEMAVVDPFLEKCGPGALGEIREAILEQKKCQAEKRFSDFIMNDDRMHRVFFTTAGMQLAWETIQGVNGHDYRFRVLSVQSEEIIKGAIAQHERLVELIEQGDHAAVKAELAVHLRKVRNEKNELQILYPEYFLTEENRSGLIVGSL